MYPERHPTRWPLAATNEGLPCASFATPCRKCKGSRRDVAARLVSFRAPNREAAKRRRPDPSRCPPSPTALSHADAIPLLPVTAGAPAVLCSDSSTKHEYHSKAEPTLKPNTAIWNFGIKGTF